MNIQTLKWLALILTLFITTFGVFLCLTICASALTFTVGLVSLLYLYQGNVGKFYRKCAGNPLSLRNVTEGGLKQVSKLVFNPKHTEKWDRRVTGSELIDSSLQEILGYVVRDYVMPWYNLISTDNQFPEDSVQKTARALAINISNRVKDVDWIPFLTTRLVDDAASHLRLFKQAKIKLEHSIKSKSQRNSPAKDSKSSPKRNSHKRNKSEADVCRYFGGKDSERLIGNSKFYYQGSKQNVTLEDFFFELEKQMEKNTICRNAVCVDPIKEKDLLSELVEILLYILLPDEDFQCTALRFVLRETFTNCVLTPLFSLISDPDFINQTIIWLCSKDGNLPSDIFLTVLRLTESSEELRFTRELVSKEIQVLRSRDSGGDDITIKQQLSSLFYVIKLIDNRLAKLDSDSTGSSVDYSKLENVKNIQLPLDIILKNNIALSYFIDFSTSTGLQSYLFFYLNIEGWKVSVEQQLSDIHINKLKGTSENQSVILDNIRATALSIYEQYLGEKWQQKIQLNPSLVQNLFFKIRNLNEPPSEQWFDAIQAALYDKLKNQTEFLPSFWKSPAYIKLLEELDLLQQNTVEEDSLSLSSLENEIDEKPKNTSSVNNSSNSTVHNDNLLAVETNKTKHIRSMSDSSQVSTEIEAKTNSETVKENEINRIEKPVEKVETRTGNFTLFVEIIETGIVCEKGKTFGIYAVHVSRQFENGFLEEWHIYRRYSDFYNLHMKVKEKYPDLAKLPFPGKKTFNNMERSVLEKRMSMLGFYLQNLCQENVLKMHIGLRDLLLTFLEQGEYDRATSGGPISHTIDTIVNPLKSGMKTIKNMPEQLFNTVDEVVEGLTKVFQGKNIRMPEASKVGASLDIESDDNIPLRIMLLLMDEVFDLKSRNQWLRRRIVTLLRQIVRTMFGDIVNRRILDYVSYITSPKNVAYYLHSFKHSFWPNGMKAETIERDEATQYRTRVAAKIALISVLSDELKRIIGSETTRRGLLIVFELYQRPVLNRRLLYVLMEGIVTSLFPEKDMPMIFRKLYSRQSSPSKPVLEEGR